MDLFCSLIVCGAFWLLYFFLDLLIDEKVGYGVWAVVATFGVVVPRDTDWRAGSLRCAIGGTHFFLQDHLKQKIRSVSPDRPREYAEPEQRAELRARPQLERHPPPEGPLEQYPPELRLFWANFQLICSVPYFVIMMKHGVSHVVEYTSSVEWNTSSRKWNTSSM